MTCSRQLSAAIVLACSALSSGRVVAQGAAKSGVFPPVSEDYQILWQKIDALSEEGSWDAVLDGLKEYLDLYERPEVNPVVSNGSGVSLGVRELLGRYVRRLPDGPRDRWRELADGILAKSWTTTTTEILSRERRLLRHRLLRDYPYSRFYLPALREEVATQVLEGHWGRVQELGSKLLDSDLTVLEQARNLVLLVETDGILGDRESWDKHRQLLANLLEAGTLDREAVPDRWRKELEEALTSPFSPSGTGDGGETFNPLFPAVTRVTRGRDPSTFRLGGITWRSENRNSELRRFVTERSTAKDGSQMPWSNIPLPYHPAVYGTTAVFQDDDRVLAYDLRSGQELWTVRLPPAHTPYNVVKSPLLSADACYVVHGPSIIGVDRRSGKRLWERRVYYDREAKSLLLSTTRPEPTVGATRVPVFGISPGAHFDGELLLPIAARVDRESRCYLVRLDGEGRERWKTYLGSSQSSDHLGLGPTASPPLVRGDRVLYLSNQGFLAAVDGHDGTIAWIKEYPLLSARGLREAIRDENRWHVNPVLPLGPEAVLVAPQDSPHLFAVRLDDGATIWRYLRERHSTLVGHDGARCFLAGHQVTAVSVDGALAGQAVWSYPLAREPARPLGRSLLTPGRLLVSTHDSLLHLEAASGRVLARDIWGFRGGGGNLLLADDKLVVVHSGGFLVYNDLDAERARVTALPPGDPATPLSQAKFYLAAGLVERGLTALETWMSTAPQSPEPNSPLDRLYLDVAEVIEQVVPLSAADKKPRLLRAKVHVERRPRRKVASAIQLALHLEESGDRAGALEALHLALEFDVPRTEYSVDGVLDVPSEAFVRDRLVALRRADPYPQTTFARLEKRALSELESTLKRRTETKTSVAYVDLLRRFPYTQAAARASKELSTYYLDYENYELASEVLLDYLRDFPESDDFARVSLEAAHLLYSSGKRNEAKRLYMKLLDEHPDAAVAGVHGLEATEKLRDFVARRLTDPGLVEVALDDRPTLRFPAQMVWRSPADLTAHHKAFLFPEGEPPEELRDCFFSQSNETIECRELETGVPRWRVHLAMVPGFILDQLNHRFSVGRRYDQVIRGRFVGPLLVLNDHRNLFALDVLKGVVRWHVPFGSRPRGGARLIPHVERIRGVRVSDDGVLVTTSTNRLYRFSLEGEQVWERDLGSVHAAREPPIPGGREVFVLAQKRASRDQKLHGFLVADGTPMGPLADEGAPGRGVRHLSTRSPLVLDDGRALLAYRRGTDCELELIDLGERRQLWLYAAPRTWVQDLFYDPDHPGEVIAALNRVNNWPALVGISLRDGKEIWRYERFNAMKTRLTVFRQGERLYVIRGANDGTRWYLLGLEISRGADRGRLQVTPIWKPHEVPLGVFFASSRERELHIAGGSMIFPDPNSVTVLDKGNGKIRGEAQAQLNRFLVDKDRFYTTVLGGRLVILSDGGDCAFGTKPITEHRQSTRRTLDLVGSYLADPYRLDTIVPLALDFFRGGSSQGIRSALALLDRSLVSEEVLSKGGREGRELLGFLLDGIKEEAMKKLPPRVVLADRLWQAPKIDGDLDDAWNFAHRVRLASPRHIGLIAGPGQGRDWEGEEDLSAVLYTGWDDENFYFALDVEDDALRAYDRDAENWRGDCLLIGVDPDGDGGYRQGQGDQLMTLALTIPKRNKRDKNRDPDDPDGDDDDDDDDDDGRTKPEGEFSVKKKDDNSGAIYEVALPWSTFSSRFQGDQRPASGVTFGLSLLLTDDDTGNGATKTLSINSCHLLPRSQKNLWIWKYLIPEFFPRILLR
ncbi:MAG: PQQ-binding-like beta-propeller repeat protein [Planctomycetota bacterium]|nr:PQQ-binding-like beta-propeller repeat protein [Planctomycetota bacterium]